MDIMIDTEFLSFRMDSYILSIGAVAFNVANLEFKTEGKFYEVPTLESQTFGKMDEGVFNFWLSQNAEVKEAITKHPDKKSIVEVLLGFNSWLFQFQKAHETLRIWSHGAACDIPLLFHTYRLYDLNAPWAYRSPRDTRTLFDVSPINMEQFPVVEGEPEHHAYWDAVRQARKVHASWRALKGKLNHG